MRIIDTTDTLMVLQEILAERQHQIVNHGWTPDHDDRHGAEDFAWLCARRMIELCHRDAVVVADCRRLFVETAAIAVAAIEALDRSKAGTG